MFKALLDVKPDTTHARLATSASLLVGLALYSKLKRRLATVAHGSNVSDVAEKGLADVSEKMPPVEKATDIEYKSLKIWAGIMLTVNVAAWYVPDFMWVWRDEVAVSPFELWYLVLLSAILNCPATAAFKILLYHFSFSDPKLQAQRETYRMFIRCSLLDGVIFPPILALVAAYSYRDWFGTDSHCLWMWTGAAVYASQSVVWRHFFVRSKRYSESQERARTEEAFITG